MRRGRWLKWRQRHSLEAAVIGVTGASPASQAFVLGLPRVGGHEMRAVGVSLPLPAAVRHQALHLLHPESEGRRELPGSVGGLPGAPPVVYLPVRPEVVVEVETDQPSAAEFGRFRHRPRVVRVREDLAVDELPATS